HAQTRPEDDRLVGRLSAPRQKKVSQHALLAVRRVELDRFPDPLRRRWTRSNRRVQWPAIVVVQPVEDPEFRVAGGRLPRVVADAAAGTFERAPGSIQVLARPEVGDETESVGA